MTNQSKINFLFKWARALNSGEYKQGSGYMCSTYAEYCCLGVAADILGIHKDDYVGRGTPSEYTFETPKFHQLIDLIEVGGLSEDKYILMNDTEQFPFSYISKQIVDTTVEELVKR